MSPRRPPTPRRGQRRPLTIPGDPADPAGFSALGTAWLEWRTVHNFSPTSRAAQASCLSLFVAWAEVRGITRPTEVTLPVLEAYQRHVAACRKPDGLPLAWSTQSLRLVHLRQFFSWCARSRHIAFNPAAEVVLPKQNRRLPAATLTHTEAEAVLSLPDTTTPLGLRDRAAMELLYATAMRRGELLGLDLPDVDLARGWLTLRTTKNRYDRVVPMGPRATAWLLGYLDRARPQLVCGHDPHAVILAQGGERLSGYRLSQQVHHYLEVSGVGKPGACHLFRHTAATLMVERGADIRYVQELLGHRDLNSTTIYTRVAPERLAAIHRVTHPGTVLPPTATCAAGRHEDCPATLASATQASAIPCGCPCHDPEPAPVVAR